MKLAQSILSRFKTKFGQAITVVIVATLLLRFPLLTAWCDESFRAWLMSTADAIRTLAMPAILLFAKSFTETGGTVPLTPEATKRTD